MNFQERHKKIKPSPLLKMSNDEENKWIPKVTFSQVSVLYGLSSAVNSTKLRRPYKRIPLPTYFIYG